MTRTGAIAAVLAVGVAMAGQAEAEPDARLVGLGSVRLEFSGLPDASNPGGLSDEELKLVTGLTRPEWVALGGALRAAVLRPMAERGVPVAEESDEGCCGCGAATTPSLVFRVSTSPLPVKPGAVYFSVVAELMEPAELIRRAGVRGRVATWSNAGTGVAEDGMLQFHLQAVVSLWAKVFAESYDTANPRRAGRAAEQADATDEGRAGNGNHDLHR